MRNLLETHRGERLYVFTTLGQVYVGVVLAIVDDVVQLGGGDAQTPVFINLSDVSGVRGYDLDADEAQGGDL
jgi:hypothetical protein